MLQSIIALLPMFISLFGVFALQISPHKNCAKKYLSYFLLVVFVNYFIHGLFFSFEYKFYAAMESIWFFTSLSVFPLYYIYIRLLSKDEKIDIRWFWLLAPAIAVSLFSFYIYFSMNGTDKALYLQTISSDVVLPKDANPLFLKLQPIRQLLFNIFFVIQILIYLFFGIRLIVKFNNAVKEYYSNVQHKCLCRVHWVLGAYLFTAIISAASVAVGKDFFIDKGMLLAIPSLFHSLFLLLIIYVGICQDFTIIEFNLELNANSKNEEKKKSENRNYPSRISKEALETLMHSKLLFTNPELRITDVATELQTNRTYISRIVNDELKLSFSEWVNYYRINYAKELMSKPEYSELSLQDISEMSGFSSISVFYRVFNQKEKLSPGKYRKKA